jgi:release factor glutamine methyltransferase
MIPAVKQDVAPSTIGTALAAAIARLAAAGVVEARANAEVLLAHVLGTTRTGLVLAAGRALEDAAAARYDELVARAAAREPVHYLVGEREFWSIPLVVDPRVLIPRPVTELLVETALRVAPRARRIYDVGTGSGAIAAALAHERPDAAVWASDRDRGALAVARANLARHAPRVMLVCADLTAAFRPGAFDLVVANLPYVADAELPTLAPEVRDHEPRLALAGGPDGLAVLRRLVAAVPDVLEVGGWLVVECGRGQAAALRAAFGRDGQFAEPVVVCDGDGMERVMAAVALGRRMG